MSGVKLSEKGKALQEAAWTLGVAGSGIARNVMKRAATTFGDLKKVSEPDLVKYIFGEEGLRKYKYGDYTESVHKRFIKQGTELVEQSKAESPMVSPVQTASTKTQAIAAGLSTPTIPKAQPQQPVIISQTNNAQSAALQMPVGSKSVSSNRESLNARYTRM